MVNTTYRMALWADMLYAMDPPWWRVHAAEVLSSFRGERVSPAAMSGVPTTVVTKEVVPTFGNSGAGAVSLAMSCGARRVLLLGYDAKRGAVENGRAKVHWHGDHPRTLGNAGSMPSWPKHFAKLAEVAAAAGVEVINCSRDTALTCFARGALEEELGVE